MINTSAVIQNYHKTSMVLRIAIKRSTHHNLSFEQEIKAISILGTDYTNENVPETREGHRGEDLGKSQYHRGDGFSLLSVGSEAKQEITTFNTLERICGHKTSELQVLTQSIYIS